MHRHTVNSALALSGVLLAALAGATQSNELHEAMKRKPNMEHGSALYQTCAACHQPDGAGVADGHIPVIAGQHYEVIIAQLVAFRDSGRVDLRMNAFAARHHLANSQDIADVAAYISSMPAQHTNEAGTGEFIALGAQVYKRACVTCHGAAAEGDSQLRHPRLAGQHYRYLVRQIHMMIRDTHSDSSRDHSSLLKTLTEEEITGVADYVARLRVTEESPGD
jgi:cytochrome c553